MTSEQKPSSSRFCDQPVADLKYPVIVVDCETTGLDHRKDFAVEVAWWNLSTGERDCFVPPHSVSLALRSGSVALEMNGYRERIMWRSQDNLGDRARDLEDQLIGATLAGSNPSFDAEFLTPVTGRVWHYRLWDLSAYAAGALALNYLPGLADVCDRLGVEAPDHTAEGDVTATGRCLLALMSR